MSRVHGTGYRAEDLPLSGMLACMHVQGTVCGRGGLLIEAALYPVPCTLYPAPGPDVWAWRAADRGGSVAARGGRLHWLRPMRGSAQRRLEECKGGHAAGRLRTAAAASTG